MKFSLAIFSALVATCAVAPSFAQSPASREERVAARLELARAKMELQNYWQIELPRQQRELNFEIEMAETELKSYKQQIDSFRPFTRFTIGEPFPVTIANLKVCRTAAELRLNNLRAERNALLRFRGNDFRFLELKVQAARQRVAELEANDEPAAAPAPSQG